MRQIVFKTQMTDSGSYVGETNETQEPHGYGRFICFKGPQILEGQWLNGQLNGYGREISAEGDCYLGNFKDGKRHGKGIMFYQTKDIYEGSWFENYYHDSGTFYYAQSHELLKGQWKNG